MPSVRQKSFTRLPLRLLDRIITVMPAAFNPSIHAFTPSGGVFTALGASV